MFERIRPKSRNAVWLIAILLFAPLGVFAAPGLEMLELTDARVQSVKAVQEEVTADWMRQPEVIGTAIGLDKTGSLALLVYIDRNAPRADRVIRDTPSSVRGTKVEVRLTDKFRSRTGGVESPKAAGHRSRQTPPIELGTSGGSRRDAVGTSYCCGGTLGSLVSIGGTQYVLSNYHVFEGDIVPGANASVATNGDVIAQPGLMDVNCQGNAVNNVATLVMKRSLPGNNVDCAVAQVIPGMVRSDGSILEIGPISSTTLAPALNQPVKKSGRTTGLTRSHIDGLNATVTVDYDTECGGSFAFSETFHGQILFANPSETFETDGDSGSLIVEDVAINPRAIGLLFAGNSTSAVANPIGEVLGFLGATMVGEPANGTRIISLSGDLAFGDTGVGVSATRNLTITNTGTSTLTVTSINYPSCFSGNWSGGTIPPGGSRNVTVTFSPVSMASFGGTVTVNSNATAGANTIVASGTGIIVTRIISVSGDLAFGDVFIESPHPQRTVTISNTGNSPLTISSIAYPFGFSGNWSYAQIPPGGSKDLIVTFWPSYVRSYEGVITFNSDKTSGGNTIIASGNGLTLNPTRIIFLEGYLDFGNIPVGTTAQLTLYIRNHGNSPLTVTSISYPDGFSGNWSGGVIPPSDSRLVAVKFLPVAMTSYGGMVTVNSDMTSGTNTMAASGNGALARFSNISTRLKVGTGDNALIGGFIITGTEPSKVIVRAIGPSLTLPDKLADPMLELRNSSGALIATNDDWRSTQEAEITGTIPPLNDKESAIVQLLDPGAYTAVIRDVNNATGVGLVEVYDLSQAAGSRLGNISTRGFVDTGDNVMIGGTIVTGLPAKVVVRAIGPSLAGSGVANALQNPMVELINANGFRIEANDDWRSGQAPSIIGFGLAPSDDRESAVYQILVPGAYTAIVRGKDNSTGIAVVEAYQLP
jgi:hypothetical protein